ncbi:MAG: 4Fe-4S binding protein, partial [Spirochaetes bacterium]|nr:4Fe-4S binding protein [Spirochaetota bacterium]
ACPVEAISSPEKHTGFQQEKKNLPILYGRLLILPVLLIGSAIGGYYLSIPVSLINKDVRLYYQIQQTKNLPEESQPVEVTTFLAGKETVPQLEKKAAHIQKKMQLGVPIFLLFFIFIVWFRLFSLERTEFRRQYGQKYHKIQQESCINCGRCFAFCPVSRQKKRESAS